MERRGSQGKSSYDFLSWSNEPDGSVKGPVRHNATNNSQGYSMANDESPTEAAPLQRPAIRILQPSGASQIQFSDQVPSAVMPRGNGGDSAKQRELSGTQETYEDQPRRAMSNAKAREMIGSNIFGASSEEGYETPDRRRPRNQKAAEMSGNGIFESSRYNAPEKYLSDAKKREMSGSDIFSEEKQRPGAVPMQPSGRVRKPPDVQAKIHQFTGSNPVQPNDVASAEAVAHPLRMSDKQISGAKMKEINGNYDLFGDMCDYQDKKSEKQHSGAKKQEMVGNYDLLSYAPDRHDNADYIQRDKAVSKSKLKELSGSYTFGDCFSLPL